MPRFTDEYKPALKPCTLREWKNFIFAEDASKTIIERFPQFTPLGVINERLSQMGYVIRKAGATTLGANVTVTKLPPGEANATPLRILRQQAEEAAERGESRISLDERDVEAEHAAERRMETYGAARAGGMSVSDALDEANEAEYTTRRRRY